MSELALLGGRPVRTTPFSSWPIFDESEEAALLRTLRSGAWGKIDGGECAAFEERFARAHGCKHGVACVNGSVTLRIALLAAGVQAGDEVIIPPYTFIATATAVVEANATPIFVDIDADTFNIDAAAIEAAITTRTRAIIPVHMGGLCAEMEAINALAKKHQLTVIEDAAHAHAAIYRGRPAGSWGDMASFSFQSSKNLNSGEGGILISNNDDLAANARSIHNCGRKPGRAWYEHFTLSGNYRLGEFQAAILSAQMNRLEEQTSRREENGRFLAERLSRLKGIVPQRRTESCDRHAYHLFLFRLEPEVLGVSREVFVNALTHEGIPVAPGYPLALYDQRLFLDRSFGPYNGCRLTERDLADAKARCPRTESICHEQGAWIPHHVLLGSREDMLDIAMAFEKVHRERSQLQSRDLRSASAGR